MDQTLRWTFAGLAVLFSVWMALILGRYFRYRRLAPGAVLAWQTPRPWYFNICFGIGLFMWVLTFVSAFLLRRPTHVVVAEGLMAVFYSLVFPLVFRIRKGFYQSGIWAESGFVPYRSIRWLGWKESPEIVLAMRTRKLFHGQKYAFLRVPGDLYGQARRILADAIKSQALTLETSILGLDTNSSIQDRV